MLALPARGIARSINSHNVRLDVLCDWLESSVLFEQISLTASDVVDLLLENTIYERQSFAWTLMGDAWTELRRRNALLQAAYPLAIQDWRLDPRYRWEENPAHSFCLALALAEWLPDWARSFGKDYTEQGALFEQLVVEAIATALPDWHVHPTGWSKTKTAKLPEVVKTMSLWLGEPETGNRERWTKNSANEAGLDLVCIRRMPDGRPGIPIYLLQCASGVTNTPLWQHKLRTPDIRLWAKLVDFAVQPKRGFATPFAFTDEDFRHHCRAIDGLLLDRHRLLSAGVSGTDWLARVTARELRQWLRPRVRSLPLADRTVVG